jgi:methyl-accepting chemotaxis protein
MKNLGIRSKFLLPVGLALAIVIVTVSWVFVSYQSTQAEEGFRSKMETLAVCSGQMMHTSAAEYVEQRGLAFHRLLAGSTDTSSTELVMAFRALRAFQRDAALQALSQEIADTSGIRIFSFAPARVKDECINCHTSYGLETFKDKKLGDLVAVFGVSGSTAPLQKQEAGILTVALLMGVAILVVIGLQIAFFVHRILIRPLRRFMESTLQIASGDLTVTIPVTSGDELGRLGNAFNDMTGKLRETMLQVTEAAGAVSSAVVEIGASVEEMASGASEQSTQAGSVAAAVEEMTRSIADNSQSAVRASDSALGARKTAEEGGAVVTETVEGMKRIAQVVRRSSTAVKELGKSGDRIGEIVSVIDDIADQTNLLALNAAIEAARVGEAGRGFAVVADEVRKLADRTTGATKEIAAMIREIQNQTAGAVATMDEGNREVDSGITMADQAGVALTAIVENSTKLTDMVAQIAAASEEQSRTSENISESVDAINRVSGETSQGSHQIARAAEDLNRLTERLRQTVSMFRVNDTEHRHPHASVRREELRRQESLVA